jgi:hypothetical protein
MKMKKFYFLCMAIILAMIGTTVVAQEAGAEGGEAPAQVDPRAAMAAAMAAQGIVRPGQITTPMGKITINGMVMTGLQAYMADNTAVDDDDDGAGEGDWTLQAWDPVWQENAVKLSLTYDNGKYGGYVMIAAEDWSANLEKSFNNVYMPYFFVWRSFFDDKFKVTLGKLYDENFQTRERVWKTEGASGGGWQFSNSNNYLAARLEYKPIDGLSIGAQWNFLPLGQNLKTTQYVPKPADLGNSFKEVGLAAEYKNPKFNILAGVRFDGNDGINKYDTYSYLKDYYGDWGYVGHAAQSSPSIHWKYKNDVYGTIDADAFGNSNYDKPFSGSTRALFGFNFMGVQSLTAKMQASLWNIGDFERFGTGSIDETLGYAITPKFSAGVVFYQDFYGSDAFPDDMVNSPYFRFEPNVSYQLTNDINASLLFTYGIAKDVIESDWRIKPALTFTLGGFGSFRGQFYYELNAITYTDEAASSGQNNGIGKMMLVKGGDALYKHNVGLSVMWMF